MHTTHRLVALPILLPCILGLAGCGGPPDSRAVETRARGLFADGAFSGRWPGWGGPDGDFKLQAEGLAASWPPEGPLQVWNRPLGPGYSAIVADRGALFTMYRDGDEDVVIALRADDGEPIWRHRYEARTREGNVTEFGSGPNATPLLIDDRMLSLGYTGVLNCLRMESGEPIWSRDLIREFDGEVLDFGYSASPVLYDGKVIVLVGGERQAVIAFDPADGSVVWSSRPGSVSYATPSVMNVDGQDQIVYFSADEVVGLEAKTGNFLWSHPCVNQYRNNAAGAIWGDDNLLWVATQLDGGTRVLRLSRSGGRTDVQEVWSNNKIGIHFWNALRLGDHVYTSIGSQASILAGINVETGEILWRERGFEQANFLQAGDKTIFLDAKGRLALVDLAPDGLTVRSQVRIVEDVTWTVPTLVDTRLYVRDKSSIRAFELGG